MENEKKEIKTTLKQVIEMHKVDFAKLLPDNVTADKFVRTAQTAVLNNPDIVGCQPVSIIKALLKCAGDGLLPDNRDATFTKYKDECVYTPMYYGLQKIARQSGEVKSISTQVVHENDECLISLGSENQVKHIPCWGERGKVIGFYSIVKLNNEEILIERMTKEEVDGIRKRAKTDKIWSTDFNEMGRKTVFRRLFKWLPTAPQLVSAFDNDNETYHSLPKKEKIDFSSIGDLQPQEAELSENKDLKDLKEKGALKKGSEV